MANSLTAFNPEYWAQEIQPVFYKENMLLQLANVEVKPLVSDGDTINKPYRSHLYLQNYTKGTDVTVQDVSGTNEQLSVATAKTAAIYYDDIDGLQNKWDLASEYAQEMARLLNNDLEQAFTAEYSNATSSITAADMGGSGSGTFSLNTANIMNMFVVAKRKLGVLDIPRGNFFAIIGERDLELLTLYVGSRETGFGDNVEANGFTGKRFGFDVYVSNNLPFGATWTPADNPSDGDTVSVGGVTFTFESGALDTAGEIDIGATTAATITNLVACINQTGTAGTDYVALSDADRFKTTKAGITATDNTTNVAIAGYGDIVVSASETNDLWSAQSSYPIFGMKKVVQMLIQMPPKVQFTQPPLRFGKYGMALMLYGKKTLNNLKDALVYAKINASSWT